jgi:lipopolysaccharide/colanic/teichoic acid biosynthesis glycosyltransferase
VSAVVVIPSHRSQPWPAPGTPLAKSALDRSLAALLLLLTCVWLAVIALAVWLTDDGPLLTREERVGRGGRSIRLLRFRTSTWGGTSGERSWPGSDDGTSSVGRVLERFHLDVLPRLVNVLRGDLSLAGPRPRPATDARATLHVAVRPGLVDPWDPRTPPRSAADEVRAVQDYLAAWSPWQDVVLAWRAVRGATPSRRPGPRTT